MELVQYPTPWRCSARHSRAFGILDDASAKVKTGPASDLLILERVKSAMRFAL